MARTEDRFLVRESKDTTVAGEVWAVKTGETIYGIAGADGNAEKERKAAEDARKAAETARASAESARASAESARADAEQKRAQAESARAAEETKRTQAEESRKSEESKRAAAESKRVEAETARASSEESRKSEESKRAAAETSRAQAEGQRSASETSRADKERERIAAETARAEAERGRASAETARAQAESARADAQAKNNADQALNNEQMKKLSPVILQAGQYDPSTLTPTVTGEPNRVYFVPMVAPAAIELYDLTAKQVEAGNLYVEWMWVGGKWELMGQSEMKAKPITTDQVDAVFAGTHPTGDNVLNLTGLDYVRTKDAELLDGKADASHTHTAGDIASGTLDPARVPVLPTAKVDGLQAALDGKQPMGEYAAKAHTHPTADVDGLQGALDGKQPKGSYANASHRHNTGDINNLDSQLNGIRDSVSWVTSKTSGYSKIVTGSKVISVNAGDNSPGVISDSEFRSMVGRSFDMGKDVVIFMNGDWQYDGLITRGAFWVKSRKMICCGVDSSGSARTSRINFAIIAGA